MQRQVKVNHFIHYARCDTKFALPRADLLGTGPFYGDAANKAEQKAYETVNLRLGYEMRHFDVYLWVENVFDQEYLTWLSPYNNNTVGLDGPPRTFGATVVWRF